jgi:hypothetical protein
MDDRKHSISPDALCTWLGSEAAPIIAGARRDADFDAPCTWCRKLQAETHNWPARAVGA